MKEFQFAKTKQLEIGAWKKPSTAMGRALYTLDYFVNGRPSLDNHDEAESVSRGIEIWIAIIGQRALASA